ncbi:MAG TPA: HD domain-containing protein [Anaerolineales bacterium]|nr:HD domain-containing protein [Anaerolineales bacterium]
MAFATELRFPPLLDAVHQALEDVPGVYLVGGSVRDALLGKTSHDLDFVMAQNALSNARRVANALGAAYYTMDEEFQTGRVVLEDDTHSRINLDFTAMQGETLDEDLRQRDFTLNAMAVDLQDPTSLIDPLGGASDLLAKRLQACSPTALADDPVRALRAVRMSASYGLTITPETRRQIPGAVARLDQVSIERLRDEFFKVLDAPKPAASLRVLDVFGIIEYLIPEMAALKGAAQSPPHIYDVWEHSLHTVQKMENVFQVLEPGFSPDTEQGGDIYTGLLSHRLGRYRPQFSDYLQDDLTVERSHRSLLYFAAFCHDFTKPRHRTDEENGKIRYSGHDASGAEAIQARAAALKLSRSEIKLLTNLIRHHHAPLQFSWYEQPLTKRAVYGFWRDTAGAGVAVCLLSIADVLAIYGHTMPQTFYEKHLEGIRTLLEAYWEHPEQVSPELLLDGHDLMTRFSLKPGPQIGELLEHLREAQAVGEVGDKDEALAFITGKLTKL